MNEETLLIAIRLAKAGDVEVSYSIWQYLTPIWRKWKSATRLPDMDAEDLTQQSYLILLNAIEKYEEDSPMSFLGYYKVRLHVWAGRRYRKYNPIQAMGEDMLDRLNQTAGTTDVSLEVEHRILTQPILSAIHELPDEDQLLLELSILQGLKAKEIAELMKITPAAVRKRKQRLLEFLKQRIPSP